MAKSDSRAYPEYSFETSRGPVGQKVASLQREAVKYKSGNLPAAVACLEAAADLMRQHPGNYPLDRWLRLPMVLQHVGHFDEAIEEFHRLLDEIEERVNNEFSCSKPVIRQKIVHLNYFQIDDKMSLACKRQKLVNQAKQYAVLAEQHYQEFLDKSD
ncbi:hypothetical protein [Methylomonas fluvii]|uniref:Tetratricopeptide repeat protein n=1 Tax=Methylomonas fluvii TaxID=1854564 RepID=A0ABR9DGU5_9GAMM|nr:hypothetical protein [Methylomonas fluvii]MBD9362324.1 hypothetical protein [Methylomonas fluvii]CAD6875400.1 hypothetical protein [Methylomonas fluvii]